jgi:hypothetical protein
MRQLPQKYKGSAKGIAGPCLTDVLPSLEVCNGQPCTERVRFWPQFKYVLCSDGWRLPTWRHTVPSLHITMWPSSDGHIVMCQVEGHVLGL